VAPVVGIIVVVFGILGFLFMCGRPRSRASATTGTRRTSSSPAEKAANAGVWESGVHTHADGIMHITVPD
jgi:hypothetical protein